MLEQIPLIFTALAIGVLVGLTGVGGGAVMTPVLILFFGVQTITAIATDLLFATITKMVATVFHSRQRTVDWPTARLIWRGSIPAAIIGVLVAYLLSQTLEMALSVVLVLVLVFTSMTMLQRETKSLAVRRNSAATAGGAFIGFSVATTSVGAGALGMALLRSLIGDKDPRRLVGTDLVHAIPIALIAGTGYAFLGFLDFSLLATMLLGSIPGVMLGTVLSNRFSALFLRRLISIALLFAAGGILIKNFG